MKINHDYFVLNSRWENFKYFLQQGHYIHHLIDRFKWYVGPLLKWTFDFPSHIDIETSALCQMACPMCGRHLMRDMKLGHMDFDLYKRIIDECAREKVYSVKLSWRGEPLLNPRIFDMVSYAKEKGIKDVAFLTNGERFTQPLIEEMLDSGLDWVSISFDGLGETYERIRKPAKFSTTVEIIKRIQRRKEECGLRKPLVRLQSIWSAIKDDPQGYIDFWMPIVDRLSLIADQQRSADHKDFQHDPDYICQSPWQRMAIMWDGRVAQCHSDYLEKNVLGEFPAQSLREIWHGEKFSTLRSLMEQKQRLRLSPCTTCCDGGMTVETEVDVAAGRKIVTYVGQDVDDVIGPGEADKDEK